MSKAWVAFAILVLTVTVFVSWAGVVLAINSFSKTIQAGKVYRAGQQFVLNPKQVDDLEVIATVRTLSFGPVIQGEMEVILPPEAIDADAYSGGIPQVRDRCHITIVILYKDNPVPEEREWRNCPTVGAMQVMFKPTDITFPTLEH